MLKNTVASVNIIDPAYVESECSLCGGRGAVGSDYSDSLDPCPVCEGTGVAERCPCGERVQMTDVPDEHGVRLCGGPNCDNGSWDRAVAVELAIEAMVGNLLNGGGAHPDDEAEDETVDVTALPDGRPCTVGGCGRVVGDCPHLAPAYVPASRRGAAA